MPNSMPSSYTTTCQESVSAPLPCEVLEFSTGRLELSGSGCMVRLRLRLRLRLT